MDDYNILSDRKLISLIKANDYIAFRTIEIRYTPITLLFTVGRIQDINKAKDIIYELFSDFGKQCYALNEDQDICVFLFSSLREKVLHHFNTQQLPEAYFGKIQILIDSLTDTEIKSVDIQELIDKEIEAMPEPRKLEFQKVRHQNINLQYE